ncbi:MAG: right-handed parallel beta-helix repeat-containing protein [Ignavibacteriaceae bacterium]|nr:right-handed parallel beta-helix repeat-containing protein [Ignavibacteriaceae bacterium]
MKKTFTLFLLFALSVYGQYTTPGTGVNWTPDSLKIYAPAVISGTFPNYAVVNKIIVAANDKITIIPGTTLTFTGTTSGFEVNGSFMAVGTEANKITFTGATPDSTGAFDGIRFNATAVDSQSQVKYCLIQYAYSGVRCVDASPAVENNEFWKCSRGIQLSTSNAIIKNNSIKRCYEYGILINLTSNPLIEGNIIGDNNTQNTSAKNQVSIGLQGNNSPIIRNNVIYNTTNFRTGGVSLWVSGASAFSNAVIEGNTIYSNSFGITLYSSSNGVINARVANNLIYNNNINPDVNVSGSGINVNGSPFNKPVITRNTIYGNHWGVTVQNGTNIVAGPDPNLGNLMNQDTTDDGWNRIYNNLQGGLPFDMFNNCTNNIYAQNNDWGVYDSAAIELKITHKVDDPLKGLVYFMPFYDPSLIPVELKSFAGTVISDVVKLTWEVVSELNNKGFYLEKNSTSTPENWMQAGFIAGRGTTTEAAIYEYTDADVTAIAGELKYRLIQQDFDGSKRQIGEVSVVLTGRRSINPTVQTYPNPAAGNVSIVLEGFEGDRVNLQLINILGEIIYSENYVLQGNKISLESRKLNTGSGVYLLRVSDNEKSAITKIIFTR